MRPGWAVSCTCGKVPDSYYCPECKAFAGGHTGVVSVGEDFPQLTPRYMDTDLTAEQVTVDNAALEAELVDEAPPSKCHKCGQPATDLVNGRGYCDYCVQFALD